MGLGLFAQIGLVAHLFSLLVPALGAQRAGLAMGLVTVLAITGRSLLAWMMPSGADRWLAACAGYALQLAGSLTLVTAAGTSVPLILLGVVLFGAGFVRGLTLVAFQRHNPAAGILAHCRQMNGAALLQLLKGSVPKLQVQDFTFARQDVVFDF